MDIIYSKNRVPIRVTEERWLHITEEHSEMGGYYYEILETISEPEIIYKGKRNELIALKSVEEKKQLIAIYKEVNENDGFLITAFLTSQKNQFARREKVWP